MCATDRKTASALRELVYILRAQRLTLVVVLASFVLLSCLNMSVPYALKMAVATISSDDGRLATLFWIAGGVLGIYVLKNAVYYFSKSRIVLLAERVAFDLRRQMMVHLHRLSVGYYRQQQPARISSRLVQDVESIKQFISSELTKLFVNSLQILVGVVIIIIINPWLALIALILLPLNVLIYYGFRGKITRSARDAKEHVSSISGDLVEQFTSVETVKSAVSEPQAQERMADSMRKGMSAQIQERRFYLFQKVSSDLIVGLSRVVLFSMGGYLVLSDKMSPADFVGFYAYMAILYPLTTAVIADAGKFSSTRASVDRVYEILSTPPEIREDPNARPHTIREGRIEFRNVCFSYGEKALLSDLDFTIEPGEHVLMTGPSGCGKSSLLNLIPRFYDCQSGRILIDGIDVRDFALASLRVQVGFVFQECFLFNTSVMDNIRYGRPEASYTELIQAAQQAHAHEFIGSMEDGYLTRIGGGGLHLSAGERQRIGIARALLKKPRVLILDEALVSLDQVVRDAVAQEILQIAQGRTMLIVTHNPALYVAADKELRFENGTVKAYSPPRSVRQPAGGLEQGAV